MGVVPDASDDRDLQGRNDRDAIRSRPRSQDRPGFQSVRIDPSQGGIAAVRNQNAAFVCNDARCFWKAAQRGKVTARVSVNHFNTVPSHVRNENAAALGFESSMVKPCTK
ncbi:hypothetical protein V1281_007854 [Nitrobacteraceae bacterium AZCC 2161]